MKSRWICQGVRSRLKPFLECDIQEHQINVKGRELVIRMKRWNWSGLIFAMFVTKPTFPSQDEQVALSTLAVNEKTRSFTAKRDESTRTDSRVLRILLLAYDPFPKRMIDCQKRIIYVIKKSWHTNAQISRREMRLKQPSQKGWRDSPRKGYQYAGNCFRRNVCGMKQRICVGVT